MFIDDQEPEPTPHCGHGCQKLSLTLQGISKLVVPVSTPLEFVEGLDELIIFSMKTVGFYGHPPSPMPFELTQDYLGLASKQVGDELWIGAYGEWNSFEGGAWVSFGGKLPKHIEVEFRDDLKGEQSMACSKDSLSPQQLSRAYWYGAGTAALNWTPLRLELDPEEQADRMEFPIDDPAWEEELSQSSLGGFDFDSMMTQAQQALEKAAESNNPMMWAGSCHINLVPSAMGHPASALVTLSDEPDPVTVASMFRDLSADRPAATRTLTLTGSVDGIAENYRGKRYASLAISPEECRFELREDNLDVSVGSFDFGVDARGFAAGQAEVRLGDGRLIRVSFENCPTLLSDYRNLENPKILGPDGDPRNPPPCRVEWN